MILTICQASVMIQLFFSPFARRYQFELSSYQDDLNNLPVIRYDPLIISLILSLFFHSTRTSPLPRIYRIITHSPRYFNHTTTYTTTFKIYTTTFYFITIFIDILSFLYHNFYILSLKLIVKIS